MLQLSFESKTQFPSVSVPEISLEVQMFPVTKTQFERFMLEKREYGDEWYNKVLSLNPRVSADKLNEGNIERLFITGILFDEVKVFLEWLDGGFRLLTPEEREISYQFFSEVPLSEVAMESSAYGINRMINDIVKIRNCVTLLDLSLMNDCLVEWVEAQNNSKEQTGRGSPRNVFYANTWDPVATQVVPTDSRKRLSFMGLRLARQNI